jgi:hypothetical protein
MIRSGNAKAAAKKKVLTTIAFMTTNHCPLMTESSGFRVKS